MFRKKCNAHIILCISVFSVLHSACLCSGIFLFTFCNRPWWNKIRSEVCDTDLQRRINKEVKKKINCRNDNAVLHYVVISVAGQATKPADRSQSLLAVDSQTWDRRLKRGKLGPRLLLMTIRKLYTRLRLVPKSTTLDDLRRSLPTLLNTRVFFSEPTTKIRMKINLHYQQRRCNPVTLVSSNIRFVGIFAGIP